MFRENVQGGVPGVPDHPASVLTPGVGVLLAELGLVVPSATCQLPESGATLIMCLSLEKSPSILTSVGLVQTSNLTLGKERTHLHYVHFQMSNSKTLIFFCVFKRYLSGSFTPHEKRGKRQMFFHKICSYL